MSDDLQRRGLLNGFLARMPSLSYGEARVLDVCLTTIEMIRAGGDRQWQRRIATGPGDVDRSWHLARDVGWTTHTLCRGSWCSDDETYTSPNPPLEERCHACWRAACGGSAIGMALLEIVGQLAIQDREREELREAARDEMVPRRALTVDARRRLDARRDQAIEDATMERPDLYRATPAVTIGRPGDDLGTPIAVDSDAPWCSAAEHGATCVPPCPAAPDVCVRMKDDHGRSVRVAQWVAEIPVDHAPDDSDDTAATHGPAIRVLDGGGEAPDDLGEGG